MWFDTGEGNLSAPGGDDDEDGEVDGEGSFFRRILDPPRLLGV